MNIILDTRKSGCYAASGPKHMEPLQIQEVHPVAHSKSGTFWFPRMDSHDSSTIP